MRQGITLFSRIRLGLVITVYGSPRFRIAFRQYSSVTSFNYAILLNLILCTQAITQGRVLHWSVAKNVQDHRVVTRLEGPIVARCWNCRFFRPKVKVSCIQSISNENVIFV